MDKKTFNKAIKKAGSQAALARQVGCTRQNICNVMRGIPISANLAIAINAYLQKDLNA